MTKAGFHKVLGKGILPNLPLVVRAKLVSKKAEKKIQKAGLVWFCVDGVTSVI